MDSNQKQMWGWVCIVVGTLILIGTAQASGKQEQESVQFDRAINQWIDQKNRWRPGTTDQQYAPGTTWRYGSGPSTGVIWGAIVGVGLIVGGIVMLASAAHKPPGATAAPRDD